MTIISGLYQPVKFGVVLTKRLAEYFDITKPNRFVLFRAGNTTLVSSFMSFLGEG